MFSFVPVAFCLGLLPRSRAGAERSLKSVLLELLERVLEMLPVWEGFQEILHLTASTPQDKMELVTVAITI